MGLPDCTTHAKTRRRKYGLRPKPQRRGRIPRARVLREGTEFAQLLRAPGRLDLVYAGSMPKGARVLIVDDNPDLAENVSDLLSVSLAHLSVEAHISKSAEEALKRARSVDYHLAVLDLHLLDGSGLELMDHLRAADPFMQIVFITGDATVQSAIRALERGAFGYLLKPFDSQQLIELAARGIERCHLLGERDVLQRELESSQRRLSSVVDQMPAFVVALDEHGKIILWNKRIESITGIPASEMLGRTDAELGTTAEVERLPLRGGGHRSVRWKRSVVEQAPGLPPVTYAVGVDVSDELELERRTRQAERLAAAGTLAAGLAHEVRNPLNSATLQLQLLERRLRRGKLDVSAALETVSTVESEIERLSRLVGDFLAFAKPQPLHLAATDLCGLIGEVVGLLQVEANAARIVVLLDLATDVGSVPVDRERMRQVLHNLLRNAIEALNGKSGTIRVRAHPEPRAARVCVEIEDDGPGFPTDSPVFDAFYTTKEGGTGLGLAIVHRIVSEHGGTVQVKSEPGSTCFRLTLPQSASSATR
jgi:signal transduction histidine kinase